jgi:hypothetical protein
MVSGSRCILSLCKSADIRDRTIVHRFHRFPQILRRTENDAAALKTNLCKSAPSVEVPIRWLLIFTTGNSGEVLKKTSTGFVPLTAAQPLLRRGEPLTNNR